MATIPASENEFPQILMSEVAAPATPATGLIVVYAKSDGLMYWKDDTGTERGVGIGDVAAHLADATDAHDASAVSFDPTGLAVITDTDVQGALGELDAAVDALGGGSPTTVQATLGAEVNIVNATTYYDGPSGSFGAGTWLIMAQTLVRVIVTTSQTYHWAHKLWDGTTQYGVGYGTLYTAANYNTHSVTLGPIFAIVTLGGTTTLKVSVQSNRGSTASVIARNDGIFPLTDNMATRLVGYKLVV